MIPLYEIAIRLVVAAALGSIVGLERQKHEWAAGLRTHMLVCLGASLIMMVSIFGFRDVIGEKGVMLDPSRVAAQVVSGIGFLGAGTIIFLRNQVVRGLTTAAGLWTVAGIGLAVGGGMYFASAAATAIAFIILALLKPLENKFFSQKNSGVSMVLERRQVKLDEIEDVFKAHQLRYTQINLTPSMEEGLDDITVKLQKASIGKTDMLTVIDELRRINGVREVNFMRG